MKKVVQIIFLISVFFIAPVYAQKTFTNPIFPGGYADPSICRVGDDYYIVNSSFEYFPGLPIHHSKDLVNWELIGHGLHREDQCNGEMNLVDVQTRGGIHAPTIRHHNGTFYIITTNVYSPEDRSLPTKMINFIITAKDIRGPWSEPHILEGAPGIDPDIFFDDDGKVWYVGTHAPEKPNYNGEGEIWLEEIDLEKWELKGERHYLWRGACGGTWAEGPHLYKKYGKYYLLIAEGGTSHNHAVMVAMSDAITGPYESNARNPILSTRHLSYDNWVNSTGHADMIELPDGRWYMVALGIRGDENRRSNMGRETHLLPVTWEQEPFEWKKYKPFWPVVAPQTGRMERHTPLPFSDKPQDYNDSFTDNFDLEKLNVEWNFRRVPLPNVYSLTQKKGHLRVNLKPEVIKERGRAALMGFRQKESAFDYEVKMIFTPKKINEEAGISIFQQDDNSIMFTLKKTSNGMLLQLKIDEFSDVATYTKKETILEQYNGKINFKILGRAGSYTYLYSLDNGKTFMTFDKTASDLVQSRGYTGANLGVYATSNGNKSSAFADFDWVSYKGFPKN